MEAVRSIFPEGDISQELGARTCSSVDVAAAAATDDNSAGDSDHDDSRDDAGIGSGGET